MAVTSGNSVVGFGPQAAKGSLATTWYKIKVTDSDLLPVDDIQQLALEVGGRPLPTGFYKAGLMGAGGFGIQPRLKNQFGLLLFGATGGVTTTADVDLDGTALAAGSGVYVHEFKFGSTTDIKWLSLFTFVKGEQATQDLLFRFKDARNVGMRFVFNASAPVVARFDFLAREWEVDTVMPTITGDYEPQDLIPLAPKTLNYIKIPGYSANPLPVISATVNMVQQPVDPMRFERVFGSPYLDSVTIQAQRLEVELILKWEDRDLVRQILTGSTTGTTWSDVVFTSNLVLRAYAPATIGTSGLNYGMEISVPKVNFRVVGSPILRGQDVVLLRLQGVALDPGAGADYAVIKLQNDVASYTW